ncbi:hypothetical protein [Halomonas campaniensis]|uniref:hypothetical protein n=1 Tax=Halomonas campaniensis TaxID=213554 RepID=UPI003566526E
MLIDDAIHEARRLQASLRLMHTDEIALGEAALLCRALEHEPIDNVLEFALDALERIDAHLPEGTLAGLVRIRLRSLVGMVLELTQQADAADIDDREVVSWGALNHVSDNEVAFLSPELAWAAWKLAIPPGRLQRPFSPRIAAVVDAVSQMEEARSRQQDWPPEGLQCQPAGFTLEYPS